MVKISLVYDAQISLGCCQQHEVMVINLHTYNNILKCSIRKAKAYYYYSRFEKYKNDMRNTWVTIKEIISRESKTNFP